MRHFHGNYFKFKPDLKNNRPLICICIVIYPVVQMMPPQEHNSGRLFCDCSLNNCFLFSFGFKLEEKLKEKVDPELAEKIDLNGEQDVFHRYTYVRGFIHFFRISFIMLF